MAFTDILAGLNERQIEAVTETENCVRVIAGAGSGKTRALAHRYAYLVRAGGIHPGNILCVTFTSKAAGEMKSRVRSLLAEAGAGTDTSLITTYHGFCVRVLREDIGRLFYPDSFRIIDTAAQKKILEEVYGELDLKLDHAAFEKILDSIDKMKESTAYVDRLITREPVPVETAASLDELVIARYLARQRKVFALDFNDLINFTFVLFERFPDVRAKWQQKLHYIQVDEFQDSSKRELKLIDTLYEGHKNLFVVGDPDQNIYEWRGADVRILVDFDKTHPGTKTVIMDRNYRSTPEILKCANTLIDYNADRIKKSLYTTSYAGYPVVHLHAKSEEEESAAIVGNVGRLLTEGFTYSDIAVLYRSGFLSQFVEAAFMNAGIPYEIVGSMRFFDRMEIRDAVAYLKIIAADDDDDALIRILNKPRRGMGKSVAEKLTVYARTYGITLYEALRECAASREFARTGAAALMAVIDKLRADSEKTAVSELLDRVLTETGYEKYIRESGNMERFDNLTELKRIAHETEQSYGKLTVGDNLPPEFMPLSAFLQHVALMREDDDGEVKGRDCVKLMTIHASKGLEFPAVFLVGMTDGVLPSSRSLEERRQAGLEEERRLCFVAVTRAKKRLFFTDSEGSGQGGARKQPSRFLKEIGEDNYVRVGEISKDLQNKAYKTVPPAPQKTYTAGDEVDHVLFGHGTVESVDAERRVYNIRFDKSGDVKPIADDYDFGMWQKLGSESPSAPPDEGAPQSDEAPPEYKAELIPKAAPRANNTADTAPVMKRNKPPKAEKPAKTDDSQLSFDSVGAIEAGADEPDISAVDVEVPEPKPSAPPVTFEFPKIERVELPERENNSDFLTFSLPKTPPEEIQPPQKQQHAVEKPSRTADHPRADGADYPNLWNDPSVPKTGWICTGVTDLGEPVGICAMCGKSVIRYVHHMSHPNYRGLGVGCVCAGKMEGDPEGAKERENRFKSTFKRRETFVNHKLKRSKKGNEYFKSGDDIITVLPDKFKKSMVKAVVRDQFTASYPTVAEALSEAFDILEREKYKKDK